MTTRSATARSGAASWRWCRSGSASFPSPSPTRSRPASAGLSLARDAGALGSRLRRQRPVHRRRPLRGRRGRSRDRPDDAAPQRPPSALRRLARAPVRSQAPRAAGRGLLPHRRGVRRRVGTTERSFPFLLGVELSLFLTWNLATLRRLPARVRDSRPDEARRRPDLPARVPGAARADDPDPRSSSASPSSRASSRSGSHRALPGGLPDPRHRHRRQPPRRLPDPRRPRRTLESHPDDAVREVA